MIKVYILYKMGTFQKIKDKVSDLTGRVKIGPYKHYIPEKF